MGAARARRARPARGHARGARAAVGGRGGPVALRHVLDLRRARLLAARGGHRRRQPARLRRRDGLPDRRTRADPLLEEAELVVFDLETTGLSAARDRICEFGAVRVRALEPVDSFQSLVNPGVALPDPSRGSPDCASEELRGAPSVSTVLAPLPRLRRRFAPRRAQRPLRPALPRAPALAPARPAPLGAAALHRRARSAPARGPRAPRQPRLARAFLRRPDRARATAPCPMPRRRPRCWST